MSWTAIFQERKGEVRAPQRAIDHSGIMDEVVNFQWPIRDSARAGGQAARIEN
jgi:hypothetical protein